MISNQFICGHLVDWDKSLASYRAEATRDGKEYKLITIFLKHKKFLKDQYPTKLIATAWNETAEYLYQNGFENAPCGGEISFTRAKNNKTDVWEWKVTLRSIEILESQTRIANNYATVDDVQRIPQVKNQENEILLDDGIIWD